jgi:hypothetical protein
MRNHDVPSPWNDSSFSYPALARYAVTYYLQQHAVLDVPEAFSLLKEDIPELRMPKACFVSIKCMEGSLRGCMGTLFPSYSCLMEELIANALFAAFQDPRFHPVHIKELPSLTFSCDLLEPPQETSFDALNPKILGIIVSRGERRGVLLPNLEGIHTPQQQLEIAMKKAGIFDSSLEDLRIMSFRVQRYEE